MSKLAEGYYQRRAKRFNTPVPSVLSGQPHVVLPIDREHAYTDKAVAEAGGRLGVLLHTVEPYIAAGLRSHAIRNAPGWPKPAPTRLPKQDGRSLHGNRDFPAKVAKILRPIAPRYSLGVHLEALHRDEVPQTVLDRAAGEKETGNRFARLPEAEDTQVYFLLRGQTQYEGYGPSHLFAFVMGSLVLRQSVPTLTFMECGLMKAEVRAMGLPLD